MLKTNPNNPIPEKGQLLIKEHNAEDGSFQSSSLAFVDDEIVEGQQWMYTEVAMMEDFGNGLELYNGFESGGMPPKYTRIATDEDIIKFLRMMKDGKIDSGSIDLESWLKEIESDQILLSAEKERITNLASFLD